MSDEIMLRLLKALEDNTEALNRSTSIMERMEARLSQTNYEEATPQITLTKNELQELIREKISLGVSKSVILNYMEEVLKCKSLMDLNDDQRTKLATHLKGI